MLSNYAEKSQQRRSLTYVFLLSILIVELLLTMEKLLNPQFAQLHNNFIFLNTHTHTHALTTHTHTNTDTDMYLQKLWYLRTEECKHNNTCTWYLRGLVP